MQSSSLIWQSSPEKPGVHAHEPSPRQSPLFKQGFGRQRLALRNASPLSVPPLPTEVAVASPRGAPPSDFRRASSEYSRCFPSHPASPNNKNPKRTAKPAIDRLPHW